MIDAEAVTVCATMPHLFDRRPNLTPHELGQLRGMCAACPALAQCRAVALSAPNHVGGFVAGMTEGERRAARRPRRAA